MREKFKLNANKLPVKKRKKFMSKKFFILYFLFTFSLPFFPQSVVKIMDGEINYLFNERLTGAEILALRNGDVVCNSIGKLKYSRINHIPEFTQLISAVKNVNPNHLAEIIKILPYKKYRNLTEIISVMLKDEKSYTCAPYFIDDDGDVHYIYADARIETIDIKDGKEIITERFLMKPLDYFTGQIESKKLGNFYFYQMQNLSRVRYKSFISAVGKGKMIAVISIFRYGDNWIIYALGGVDIIRLPFIDKRIDRAFYRRIRAFCLFTFERLEQSSTKDEEN